MAGVFLVQNASRGGLIGRLSFVDQHGLGDAYLATYVKRVMAVTPEDVRRVVNDYLVPDKHDARRRRRHEDRGRAARALAKSRRRVSGTAVFGLWSLVFGLWSLVFGPLVTGPW